MSDLAFAAVFGIFPEQLPGVAQQQVPGVAQQQVPGVAQQQVPGVAQQQVPGVAQQQVPGVAQQQQPLYGGYEETPVRISPLVLKEFVRLSVKNHGPTMRDIANNNKVVDDRLMRKLYKSFVNNLDDERVSKLLQKQEKAYSK